MPCCAARWIVSRRLHATHTGGCGFCTRLGHDVARRHRDVRARRDPVNGVSVMQRSATRRPSSHIARLSSGSMPNPPSSASDDDSPVPNSTRPPETRSSVAIRSATRAGWLNGGGVCMMPWPRRMLLRALRHRGEEDLRRARSGCTPRGSGARPPRTYWMPSRSASSPCSSASWISVVSESLVPRAGQLVLVEHPELHARNGSAARRASSPTGQDATRPRADARGRTVRRPAIRSRRHVARHVVVSRSRRLARASLSCTLPVRCSCAQLVPCRPGPSRREPGASRAVVGSVGLTTAHVSCVGDRVSPADGRRSDPSGCTLREGARAVWTTQGAERSRGG